MATATVTKKKSKSFAKMTPAQKRVRIAMDVIAQIQLGRLQATNGTYFQAKIPGLSKRAEKLAATGLKEALAKVKKCEVCAIGAAFVCAVDRFNTIKIGDLESGLENHTSTYDDNYSPNSRSIDDSDMRVYLDEFFEETQLRAIEACFENWTYEDDGYYNLRAFLNRTCEGSDDRLIAIMKNVIKGKGKLKEVSDKVAYGE